jgi:hypothetical protein
MNREDGGATCAANKLEGEPTTAVGNNSAAPPGPQPNLKAPQPARGTVKPQAVLLPYDTRPRTVTSVVQPALDKQPQSGPGVGPPRSGAANGVLVSWVPQPGDEGVDVFCGPRFVGRTRAQGASALLDTSGLPCPLDAYLAVAISMVE